MPRLITKRKNERAPKKGVLVFYHKNCTDGFGAAWSAWKKFGKNAEYIALNPRELPSWPIKNKEVYMLDNSFKPAVLKKLLKENKKVIVIDHHASSEKDVKIAPSYIFDLKHSGAVLSWKYFHLKKPVPRILLHIEDEDLWKFRLPYTKEIFAAIDLTGFEFKKWNKIAKEVEGPKTRKELIKKGSFVLHYEDNLVKQIAEGAEIVRFEGIKTLAANSPVLESQLGNYLYKKMPPIGIVWRRKNGKVSFSLRSDGSVNVGKIAKKYGGGGHPASSGFSLPGNSKLPWKVLKNEFKK